MTNDLEMHNKRQLSSSAMPNGDACTLFVSSTSYLCLFFLSTKSRTKSFTLSGPDSAGARDDDADDDGEPG